MHRLFLSPVFTATLLLGLAACGDSSTPPVAVNLPGTPTTPPVVNAKCGVQVMPRIVSDQSIYLGNGRRLDPQGQMVTLGNFPTGGSLTPDGCRYWAVDAGLGKNAVRVVNLKDWSVEQTLHIPGGEGAVCFTPDGKRAFVSGHSRGAYDADGPVKAENGDAIHVYDIADSGIATEAEPMILSPLPQGTPPPTAIQQQLPPGTSGKLWPSYCAVSPDGKWLAIALNQADRTVVLDLAQPLPATIPTSAYVQTGGYPYGVAIDNKSRFAYVSNQYAGTLTRVVLATKATSTITVGGGTLVPGTLNNTNSQPQGVIADARNDRVFVAVTNRDLVAEVNTETNAVSYINVGRSENVGASPVKLALSPTSDTLYVANANEDAIVGVALTDRGTLKKGDVIGKLPTTSYASDVQVTPDGRYLIWLSARGVAAGGNPEYHNQPGGMPPYSNSLAAPYGAYVPTKLIGRAGIVLRPTDAELAALTPRVNAAIKPANFPASIPADTPVHGAMQADGSFAPSDKIKYVFYVIRENRSYDQVFGCDPRGEGDCSLEVIGDNVPAAQLVNGAPPAGKGATPNQHEISRQFVLLDRGFSNSEVSTDGHLITGGGFASDYSTRSIHPNYGNRGRVGDASIARVSFAPKHTIVDQASRQGLSYRIYGERGIGNITPNLSDDGRSTYADIVANTDTVYPNQLFSGCTGGLAPGFNFNSPNCTFDSEVMQFPAAQSRIRSFKQYFQGVCATAATCQLPQLNVMIIYNDHTNGFGGIPAPDAMCADNDLALGQLTDFLSKSPIWNQSAIFIIQDDVQDAADHVDAHRMPMFVVSPYTRRGGTTISTRYDQYSVLRTMGLILGMPSLSINDANATPMYDVFASTPDAAPYTAITPQVSLTKINSTTSATAKFSNLMPWAGTDLVPQQISDAMLWKSVYGEQATPPRPGPNASAAEAARAKRVMELWKQGAGAKSIERYLLRSSAEHDD